MNTKRRGSTKEFKRDALELWRTSGESAAQIERDLGITKGLVLKWRDRYQVKEANGEAELAPSDLVPTKTERNAEIRARYEQGETVGELASEFDISERQVSQIVRDLTCDERAQYSVEPLCE